MLGDGMSFDPGPLCGELDVPGDKSISHRALIAGAFGRALLRITNLNPGRDVRATREALLALGVRIEVDGAATTVRGGPLREPAGVLDCMNSGSTARMLLGVCAGAGVRARFDGDRSLRRRPMEPVAAQLRAFGARIETTEGRLPLECLGTPEIQTRRFILLVPSAQVKSALLFAALFSGVGVRVDGDRGSRDHTERLLSYLGLPVEWDGHSISLAPRNELQSSDASVDVAGDFSAAAFFITAAAVTPRSSILIRKAGVNPTRTGLLDVLKEMGARIELRNVRSVSGEPVADIVVAHAPLHATAVGPDLALRAIDEIPLVAIAAAFADGSTTIAGIGELRTKESDRIAAIERLLQAVSIETQVQPAGLTVRGGRPSRPQEAIATDGDHRIAMAAAVLGCAAGPLAIDSAGSIDVSFPGFVPALEALQSQRV
jgi:3-phosphoshikimate 1-carboxyvinyltransferase